ncbi:uncharacterized protein isoform X2 [Leptinotarsa decemlineata]|uniref:uncharacterized protein isoform X2 n=1 Tax=Leptinotarsa decemlineata TaxID=7539 RepID=UPI003D30CF2E
MDNPDEDNMDKWILVDSVEKSDLESDGISIITNDGSIVEEECTRVTDDNRDNLNPKEDTKKWTFANLKINSETMFREIPPKTFFLNCLQEPVQELSDHELEASRSDLDADEITLHSENDSKSKKENIKNNKLGLMPKLPAYNHNNMNGLLIATVILAAICMYLEDYSDYNDQATDDLHHHQVNYNDIPEGLFNNIDEIYMKYNVSKVLYFCQQKYKSGDKSVEPNIRKCLLQIESIIKNAHDRNKKKEIKQLEKYLKMREHYLNEKEKFLIKKEYELAQTQLKIKSEKNQFNFKRKIMNNFKFGNFKESSIHNEFAKRQMHKALHEENIRSVNEIQNKKNDHKHFRNNKSQRDFYGEHNESTKSYFYRNSVDENKKVKRKIDKSLSKSRKEIKDKEKQTNYKYDKVKNKKKYKRSLS